MNTEIADTITVFFLFTNEHFWNQFCLIRLKWTIQFAKRLNMHSRNGLKQTNLRYSQNDINNIMLGSTG